MFYKKSNSAQEIETSVLNNLLDNSELETKPNIQTALQSLAESAEIFEAANLPEEAEIITQFIETIASGQFEIVKEAKKKSKKTKSKKKKTTRKRSKKTNDFSKDLTPEKQLDNLEHIGWVFNAPKPEVDIVGIDTDWIFNDKSDCGECAMVDDDKDKHQDTVKE